MIERLTEILNSITGDDPISNARRLAIMEMINRLQGA